MAKQHRRHVTSCVAASYQLLGWWKGSLAVIGYRVKPPLSGLETMTQHF
jgi:hypothetical protein